MLGTAGRISRSSPNLINPKIQSNAYTPTSSPKKQNVLIKSLRDNQVQKLEQANI